MSADCGCRIEYPDNPTVEVPRIVYCTLHAAAGETESELRALEELAMHGSIPAVLGIELGLHALRRGEAAKWARIATALFHGTQEEVKA